MGNTCQAKYRSSDYANMDEEGLPYYRPRTLPSDEKMADDAEISPDTLYRGPTISTTHRRRTQPYNKARLSLAE